MNGENQPLVTNIDRFGRNLENISQRLKELNEKCHHVTGWTWKRQDLKQVCPNGVPKNCLCQAHTRAIAAPWQQEESLLTSQGEPTRTLVPWRQGNRHPTRNECMGWFAQILLTQSFHLFPKVTTINKEVFVLLTAPLLDVILRRCQFTPLHTRQNKKTPIKMDNLIVLWASCWSQCGQAIICKVFQRGTKSWASPFFENFFFMQSLLAHHVLELILKVE